MPSWEYFARSDEFHNTVRKVMRRWDYFLNQFPHLRANFITDKHIETFLRFRTIGCGSHRQYEGTTTIRTFKHAEYRFLCHGLMDRYGADNVRINEKRVTTICKALSRQYGEPLGVSVHARPMYPQDLRRLLACLSVDRVAHMIGFS
jgi:hypothetical protein